MLGVGGANSCGAKQIVVSENVGRTASRATNRNVKWPTKGN